MYEIYVPNYTQGNCAYVYNENIIRVYDRVPTNNSTIDYIDYYYNSHYLFREGTTTFNNYSTLPTCNSHITTNWWHRNDITEICLLFVMFAGVNWFLISKLVKTLLRGGRIW